MLVPGTTMVFEVPQYSGLFKDNSGKLHDLRPSDDV